MILNKTNRNFLANLFGQEIEASIGKKVTLYFKDDIEVQGKINKGLRLKRAISSKFKTNHKTGELVNKLVTKVIGKNPRGLNFWRVKGYIQIKRLSI